VGEAKEGVLVVRNECSISNTDVPELTSFIEQQEENDKNENDTLNKNDNDEENDELLLKLLLLLDSDEEDGEGDLFEAGATRKCETDETFIDSYVDILPNPLCSTLNETATSLNCAPSNFEKRVNEINNSNNSFLDNHKAFPGELSNHDNSSKEADTVVKVVEQGSISAAAAAEEEALFKNQDDNLIPGLIRLLEDTDLSSTAPSSSPPSSSLPSIPLRDLNQDNTKGRENQNLFTGSLKYPELSQRQQQSQLFEPFEFDPSVIFGLKQHQPQQQEHQSFEQLQKDYQPSLVAPFPSHDKFTGGASNFIGGADNFFLPTVCLPTTETSLKTEEESFVEKEEDDSNKSSYLFRSEDDQQHHSFDSQSYSIEDLDLIPLFDNNQQQEFDFWETAVAFTEAQDAVYTETKYQQQQLPHNISSPKAAVHNFATAVSTTNNPDQQVLPKGVDSSTLEFLKELDEDRLDILADRISQLGLSDTTFDDQEQQKQPYNSHIDEYQYLYQQQQTTDQLLQSSSSPSCCPCCSPQNSKQSSLPLRFPSWKKLNETEFSHGREVVELPNFCGKNSDNGWGEVNNISDTNKNVSSSSTNTTSTNFRGKPIHQLRSAVSSPKQEQQQDNRQHQHTTYLPGKPFVGLRLNSITEDNFVEEEKQDKATLCVDKQGALDQELSMPTSKKQTEIANVEKSTGVEEDLADSFQKMAHMNENNSTADTNAAANASAGRSIKIDDATNQDVMVQSFFTSFFKSSVPPPLNTTKYPTPKNERTCFGHKETVFGISLTKCGRYLASASQDSTVRIWDVKSGKSSRCVATLIGHSKAYECLRTAWSDRVTPLLSSFEDNVDERNEDSFSSFTLASAGADGIVKLWNITLPHEYADEIRPSEKGSTAVSPGKIEWNCISTIDHTCEMGTENGVKLSRFEDGADVPQIYSLQWITNWCWGKDINNCEEHNSSIRVIANVLMTSSDDCVHIWEQCEKSLNDEPPPQDIGNGLHTLKRNKHGGINIDDIHSHLQVINKDTITSDDNVEDKNIEDTQNKNQEKEDKSVIVILETIVSYCFTNLDRGRGGVFVNISELKNSIDSDAAATNNMKQEDNSNGDDTVPFGGKGRNPTNMVYVFEAQYCPTNSLLAVALSDGSLRVVNPRGVCVSILQLPGSGDGSKAAHLTSLAWDGSGTRLASCVATGHLVLWSIVPANDSSRIVPSCTAVLQGGHMQGRPLFGVKYLGGDNQDLLLSWGIDGRVCLWESWSLGQIHEPLAILVSRSEYPIYAVDVIEEELSRSKNLAKTEEAGQDDVAARALTTRIAVGGGRDGGFIGIPVYLYDVVTTTQVKAAQN